MKATVTHLLLDRVPLGTTVPKARELTCPNLLHFCVLRHIFAQREVQIQKSVNQVGEKRKRIQVFLYSCLYCFIFDFYLIKDYYWMTLIFDCLVLELNWSVSRSHVVFACYLLLRNRKHFPCFYRVIETRVEVWENEKCCGNTSCRRVFPQLFRVLPNLHECFYNSIETRRKCFLFLLENSPRKITKNEENLIVLFIIKT